MPVGCGKDSCPGAAMENGRSGMGPNQLIPIRIANWIEEIDLHGATARRRRRNRAD